MIYAMTQLSEQSPTTPFSKDAVFKKNLHSVN